MHRLILHSHAGGEPYPEADCPIYRSFNDGVSCRTDAEVFWRSDGSSFPVEYTAHPVHENGGITGAVVVFRDISDARAVAMQLSWQATHDALTGLLNRHEFERRLLRVLQDPQQAGADHALLYLDLDQFKVVNDTCGHTAGDELLRQLGTLLQGRMRQRDTLARLGGDEFGVLLEHCPLEQALKVANGLRDTVQEFRFLWEGRLFSIGVSIGVVPIEAGSDNLEHLLAVADTACYTAKESGRNRVHAYQPDDDEVVRRHGEMRWVSRIHSALAEDRFRLWFQPILPLAAGAEGDHYEILVRLLDEDGALVPPGAFLPAAERYDLIGSIDRWVVRNTFDWLVRHPGHLRRLRTCSINLSAQSLTDETLPAFITERFAEGGIPPERVCFEITETSAIANLGKAMQFMEEMTGLGCRFALDDFGSGMSSFAYLKNLPVDYLKIDGEFVKDIAGDPIDLAMVESINHIGHVMGKQTIAEFVENDAILERLRQIGVDFAQGYGIAKPQEL